MPRHIGDHTKNRTPNDARSRAWRAMRVLQTFTLPHLAATASIKEDNARNFLLRLQREGFVRKIEDNPLRKRGQFAVWRLVRNPGPKAPIAMKAGGLFDPNTRKTYLNGEVSAEPGYPRPIPPNRSKSEHP